MAFQALYTGENSAVKLPDMDRLIRSQERMSDMVIAGQEKIQQRKEKDSDFVLNQMKANPVLLISDKLRTVQSDAIKRYNDIGAKLLAKNDGILTDDDKLILQREKDALTMTQQSMQADQQRFQQEWAVIQKDQGSYYDMEEAVKGMKQFYETGQYPPTALIAKPKDVFAVLAKLPAMTRTRVEQAGGTGYDVESIRTEQQAKEGIRNAFLQDEGTARGFLRVFESLPESEQLAILDTNKDGAVAPEEREVVRSAKDVNNPIVTWAENYQPFIDAAMQQKTVPRTATQEKGNTPVKTKFDVNLAISGGNNRNNQYTLSEAPVQLHGMSFPSLVTVKKSTTGTIVINNPIDAVTGKVIPVSTTAELIVSAYSPQTDQVVVEVKSVGKNTGGGRVKEGQTLILDGETYKGLLEHKDIGLHRQSVKGFKQGASQAEKPVISW